MITLETERLLLRPWQAKDLTPFAALNACPETMRYFPAPLIRDETAALIERLSHHIEQHGWGFWAVERKADRQFLGMTGLLNIWIEFPTTAPYPQPEDKSLELGWRFAKEFWGNGYATEAALACLEFGFGELQKKQLYAFTAISNVASRHVMERIGMNYTANFFHSSLDPAHPLAKHALYTISKIECL